MYWLNNNSTAIQAFSALAILALTVFLAVFAWWSASTSRRTLEVARREFGLEWYPELYAEIAHVAGYVHAIEVTNLGKGPALVQNLILSRASPRAVTRESPCNRVVFGGHSHIVPLTAALRHYVIAEEIDLPVGSREPVRVAFSFYAAGREMKSAWFEFDLVFKSSEHGGKIFDVEQRLQLKESNQ